MPVTWARRPCLRPPRSPHHARRSGPTDRPAAAFAACSATVLPSLAARGPRTRASGSAREPPVTSDVTMVQANIYTGLSVARFQADVRNGARRSQPDFVTYNEVPFRNDEVMAARGLRDLPRHDGPVHRRDAGRLARRPVDRDRPGHLADLELARQAAGPGRRARSAVRQLGDPAGRRRPGRLRGRRSTSPRVVRGMPDLLRPLGDAGSASSSASWRRAGPVLVGGDFNVHYTSGRYPRDLLYGGRPGRRPTTSWAPTSRPVTTTATPSTTCSARCRTCSRRSATTRSS